MNKKKITKSILVAATAITGGIIAYKQKEKIKEQLDKIANTISKSSGLSAEKVKEALEGLKASDFQEAVNAISHLLTQAKVDFNKINYDKIAENLYAWFVVIETSIRSTQGMLEKYSVWEIIGREDLSEKTKTTLHQVDEFKNSIKEVKKPQTEDLLENVKYNFQIALKKQMTNKKTIKILKVKTKKPTKKKLNKKVSIKKLTKKKPVKKSTKKKAVKKTIWGKK